MSSATGLSGQTLHTAFIDAPFGVDICDVDGKFLAISRSLASLLCRSESEVIGRTYLAFVHPTTGV
jgi:PAS domain-containing protein